MEEYNIKSSDGKHMWVVNTRKLSCTCPDYRYRQAKVGGLCKHINQVLKKITGDGLDYLKAIEANPDPIDFIEKYGEDVLNGLKLRGEVLDTGKKLLILR